MDEVTGNFHKHERDFSKIQGRFNTLISMSSANADEVIRKRLLDKKPLASEIEISVLDGGLVPTLY